jgi:hypothetical protein
LIGAEVVIENDCLPILGMMRCCSVADVAMLRWIAYVKSLNLEIEHISGKANAVADMLSRARYNDDVSDSDNEDVPQDFFTSKFTGRVDAIQEFRVEDYEGESLRIGKTIQELEQEKGQPDNKERRTETQRKKQQIRKFF